MDFIIGKASNGGGHLYWAVGSIPPTDFDKYRLRRTATMEQMRHWHDMHEIITEELREVFVITLDTMTELQAFLTEYGTCIFYPPNGKPPLPDLCAIVIYDDYME